MEGGWSLRYLRARPPRIGSTSISTPTRSTGVRPRLEGLGATFVHENDEHGIQRLTFQDPEGNDFCVGAHRDASDAPPPSTA
jgi:hypothetical protein